MATLADVVDELQDNGDGIDRINRTMKDVLTQLNMQRLDALESAREAKNATSAGGGSSSGGGGSGLGGMLAGLGGLGALAATLAAVAASATGLDAAFKALQLGKIAKDLNATFKAFRAATIAKGQGLISIMETFIRRVKNLGIMLGDVGRGLTKLVVFPDETKKLFTGFVDDIRLRWMLFVDDVKLGFVERLDTFKTSVLGIVDDIKVRFTLFKLDTSTALAEKFKPITSTFTGLVDTVSDALRPVTTFFTSIGEKIGAVVKFFPTINFSALTDIFGFAGTVDAPGKGIIGFLSGIADFARPILEPIKKIAGLALRPMFMAMITAIDFVVGFYEGFKGEEGSLLDKLTAGLEGGIKGVIKGFTEAIDLIFIELPAWIAGKLGFEGVSEKLKEFSLTALVDPAWEAVKNFFKSAMDDPSATFAELGNTLKNIPINFLKSVMAAALPDPDIFKFNLPEADLGILGKFGGGEINLNPFPDALYKFAGIDPVTGANMEERAAEVQRSMDANQSAMELEAFGPGGRDGGNVAIVDNSSGDNIQTTQPLIPGTTSAVDASDQYEIDPARRRL